MVIRYKGSKDIKEMMEKGEFIEAFVHTQLGIEKILWDKIVGMFEHEKAREVGRRIEEKGKKVSTYELIKWSYLLGAITIDECKALEKFNKGRNQIIHGHGKWWILEDNRKPNAFLRLKSL
ncbi:hypothetical protein KEJ37_05325 [Candidatus Bathyarchaeota archaeon]|nr:hypothetical protein [Candidatus Bathyarchaeota archaeon]